MKETLQKISFLIVIVSLFIRCSHNYDIVIKSGTVYDGTTNSSYVADIGILDGKIINIGTLKGGSKLIDATGLIVAPGFIDMHTHVDRAFSNPGLYSAENYLTQGVTTVVTGNCGDGSYNVEEIFNKLDSAGFGTNVVHLVGHNTIRNAVMGMDNREPTDKEMEEMKALAVRAMEGGAAGFSTGLFYAPGSFASAEEVVEIAKIVKEYKGIYTAHLRDESNYSIGLLAALKEAIKVGEISGIPVQISHIKALGKPVWGLSDEACNIIEDAQLRGVKVMADQYPYPASSTSLTAAVIPRWAQAEGALSKNLSNRNLLPRIKKEISDNIERRGGPESLVVVSFNRNTEFAGKNIMEISRMIDLSIEETVIYLCLNGSPGIISFNMDDYDVANFMKKDYVMTGSDGHVPVSKSSMIHPRSYGSFTRKIRKYVLEDKLITMEHAIRAATSLPASMLRLGDRGMIKEGFAADIVVFDPAIIMDNAKFDDPQLTSSGIQYLIINGQIVIEEGNYNGKLAGKPLKITR